MMKPDKKTVFGSEKYKNHLLIGLSIWTLITVVGGLVHLITVLFYSPKIEYQYDFEKENEKLFKAELQLSYAIQDSIDRQNRLLELRLDSLQKRNVVLKQSIKKLQSEKDTVVKYIPVRTASEYELYLSDYFKRYGSDKDDETGVAPNRKTPD